MSCCLLFVCLQSLRWRSQSLIGAWRSQPGWAVVCTPCGTGRPATVCWTRPSRLRGECSTGTTCSGGRWQTAWWRGQPGRIQLKQVNNNHTPQACYVHVLRAPGGRGCCEVPHRSPVDKQSKEKYFNCGQSSFFFSFFNIFFYYFHHRYRSEFLLLTAGGGSSSVVPIFCVSCDLFKGTHKESVTFLSWEVRNQRNKQPWDI